MPIAYCNFCQCKLEKTLTCSRCKNATYYSKECQTKHWKERKPRCIIYQESKTRASQLSQKRGLRLLQQFRDAARNESLLVALVKAFPDKRTFLTQPAKFVAILQLEFDYNYRSFVPVEPAELVEKEAFASMFNLSSQIPEAPAERGYVNHTLYILYAKQQVVAMPMKLATESWKFKNDMSWENVYELCRGVKLDSSLFATFLPGPNIKAQLQVIQQHPDLSLFLSYALAMNSAEPLHKKKVVMIELELGFGLGEVKQFVGWHVEPVTKLLADFSKNAQTLEQYRKELDLGPSCHYLARADPGSVYCPVVFYHKSTSLYFVLPNCFVFEPSRAKISKNECKRAAQYYFQKFQAVVLPPVQSPPIE